MIAITLPLLRDGKIRHILVAVMTPESFASVLAAAHIADGTVGTIVDRNGIVVATTQGQEQRVGKPAVARHRRARLPPPSSSCRREYPGWKRRRESFPSRRSRAGRR